MVSAYQCCDAPHPIWLRSGVEQKALTFLCAGGTLLTCCAPFVNIQFLGSSLTFMMVSGKMLALPHLNQPLHFRCARRAERAATSGVCLGTAASVCEPEFPGYLQLHGAVPPLGAVGIQCGAAKLTCCRLVGHASRYCSLLHCCHIRICIYGICNITNCHPVLASRRSYCPFIM